MPDSKPKDVAARALDRRPLPQESRPRGAETLDVAGVYQAHARRVWRWAQRLGGPGLDVEDVVQEVFLVVQRRLGGFRGEAQLETWLYRITSNVVSRRRRKERWRRFLGGSAEEVGRELESPEPSPHEQVEAAAAARRLYRALEGVKPRHREVLVLYELEGLSGEEIATLLGAKVATVWVWLHRARAELLRALEALEPRAPSGGERR